METCTTENSSTEQAKENLRLMQDGCGVDHAEALKMEGVQCQQGTT